MKNIININIGVILVTFVFLACSGSDDDGEVTPPPNSAPSKVSQLLFPTSDMLCIDNTVTFQWSTSNDVDNDPVSYRLVVATNRSLTQIVEQRTVSSNTSTISLERGIAYYWNVTAFDNQGNEAESSDIFAFYTEGDGISNHAPFAAALNTPVNNETVDSGTINLSWTGGDTDSGDTLTYKLYFGETSDPPLLQADLVDENFDINVTSGLYYWKVNTLDDSGLETIGQIWQFTVN